MPVGACSTVIMALPVSLELCKCIIACRYELHMPIRTVAQLANCCEKTINNVLKTFQDYNPPINPFIHTHGQRRALSHDDLNFIDSILCAEPGLYLDSIWDKLCTSWDVEISISTLSRTLSHLDMMNKCIAKEAIEHDELLQATWKVEMGQYNPHQIDFIDKAGVDNHTNYSKLPALGFDGILALDIFEGSVNRCVRGSEGSEAEVGVCCCLVRSLDRACHFTVISI